MPILLACIKLGRLNQSFPSKTFYQFSLFETDLILQLDPTDPLLKLALEIPWHEFDEAFGIHYTEGLGAPSKPIRLMVGLLILKQLENLSMKWWYCSGSAIRTTRLFAV